MTHARHSRGQPGARAPSRPGRRLAVVVVLVATSVLLRSAGWARPASEAILPVEDHAAGDARSLAQAHGPELERLHADLGRCLPGIEPQRHGIAFRYPRQGAAEAPFLTLWAWVDGASIPPGADLAARAADAFRRLAQALFRQVVGRPPVFADARVGGYGVIMTWTGPSRRDGRVVAESLAVFADKLQAASFVHATISPAVFLSRATVRAFDGQTEFPAPRLAVADEDGRPDRLSC